MHAVSKCLLASGFAFMVPCDLESGMNYYINLANYSPVMLSKAISISSLSFPSILSLTHPPATLKVVLVYAYSTTVVN